MVIGYTDNFQYLQHTPDCIVVELDDINVKPLDGLPANHVPIVPQRGSFQVHLGGKESVSVNRRHFPLVPLDLDRRTVALFPRFGRRRNASRNAIRDASRNASRNAIRNASLDASGNASRNSPGDPLFNGASVSSV